MNIVGDEGGMAALQEMKESNKDYLKFLIQEARTVFERRVDFKGKDGTAFRLSWDPAGQTLTVSRKDAV
jgi:hypothetical protein